MNLELLQLKKPIKPRGYQEIIISDILNNFNIGKPYVLGACPSSGKTEMAIEAMIRLMNSGQVNRVLVLAHSTNVLKENFYERLEQYFHKDTIEIMRGQKDYNYDARIQVMIPQNINYVVGQFDLIVTDEAQHNVLAEDGNYSRIVELVQPKFQLLLTGTPSKFILRNNFAERDGEEAPYHINTVGMDMIGFDHFHDVRFDLIKSAYGFTNEDYGQTRELLTNIDFDFEQTERTVNNVIVGVVRNIALRNGITLPTDADFVLEGRKLIQSGKFGKTLIMCRNIEQANQISEIISNLFHVKVAVSQSQNDTDSTNLDRFKKNQFQFLCVVNRAREGYDDNKVINLIDITMTHNIDLIYQMFCRVVRLDKTNPNPKLYIKVTSNAEGMPEYTMNIMTAALMLGATENLAMFNGNNFRNLVMPRVEREETDEGGGVSVDGVVDITDDQGNRIGRRRINDMMALDLVQMFTNDEENLIHGNERYAMTTLGESLAVLNGYIEFYANKEGYFNLFKKENITGGYTWSEIHNEYSERDGVRYHSNPWNLYNQTIKEFFDECYPDRIMFNLDKEGYFKLIRQENITSGNKWVEKYKELSERDGVKYRGTPWVFFKISEKEFFSECYPDREEMYSDKEGYIKLIIEENITGISKWHNNYKELSERDGVKYHSNPWVFFNQTCKEFFDECYPDREEFYSDKQGYFNLITEENISVSTWLKTHKDLSERDGVKYHSAPWVLFNQTQKEFFDECYPDKQEYYSDKQGYFNLFREIGVKANLKWRPLYKEYSKRDGVKYHSQPCNLFKQSEKEFFDECYPNRTVVNLDKEGYFKLIREEKIIGRDWGNRYKELSERDGVKYHCNPWKFFKQLQKDFFDECYPDKQEYCSDKETYFKLFRSEKITGANNNLSKKIKNWSERDGIKYYRTPWTFFDLTAKEFFDECYPDRTFVDLNKEGYFKLIKENNISGSIMWKENYKKISERECVKYHSCPWLTFSQTIKEFFEEYREWLTNNPKQQREYREAYLGEFSEMNKLWNTTNSNNTNKRLKQDKTEWVKYHELYSNSRKKWSEIPYKEIAKKLKDRPEWVVGDFGCGENLLSKEIKNKVHAFDHVAIDTDVTACDLVNVPLHNNVLDVVVFSLSLMGTNYVEYFKEAYRVLKPMGLILIAEPCTRWEDKEDDLKGKLEEAGFKMSGEIKHSDRFIYVDGIKY